MDIDQEGPLTAAELEMLSWNRPVLKPNGKFEPPDVPYEYMQDVMATAKRQANRLITNLDDLERIARKHGQMVGGSSDPSEAEQGACAALDDVARSHQKILEEPGGNSGIEIEIRGLEQ